jgi:hypothetical protein
MYVSFPSDESGSQVPDVKDSSDPDHASSPNVASSKSQERENPKLDAMGTEISFDGYWDHEIDVEGRFGGWRLLPSTGLATSVVFRDSTETSWVQLSEDCLEIRVPLAALGSQYSPIISTGTFAADVRRQAAGHFVVHAGCVSGESGSALMVGGSGAGKTSAALFLCLRYGFRFSSGDRSSLVVSAGEVDVYGTWPLIHLRRGSFVKLMDYDVVLSRTPEAIQEWAAQPQLDWNDKWRSTPDEFGLAKLESRSKLRVVAFIRVIPDATLAVERLTPTDIMFSISEAVSDFSTGRYVLVDSGGELLTSPFYNCLPETLRARESLLRGLTDVEGFRISGDLSVVCSYIAERLR